MLKTKWMVLYQIPSPGKSAIRTQGYRTQQRTRENSIHFSGGACERCICNALSFGFISVDLKIFISVKECSVVAAIDGTENGSKTGIWSVEIRERQEMDACIQ